MSRPRLAFHAWPAAIYAIGDVHGCLEQLLEIESLIAEDSLDLEGEKWLVTLGDHIDRGPNSRGVIEHVMGPAPDGLRRFALVGNHEIMLEDFIANPAANTHYFEEGGDATLASYGVDLAYPPLRGSEPVKQLLADAIPSEHRQFIASLPICLSLPGWLFVHAGIRPGIPLAMQDDTDMVWIRAPFLTSQLTGGLRVVHGHTPGPDIVVTPHRIGLDTQCYATSRLSAVRVTPDGGVKFLQVQGVPSR